LRRLARARRGVTSLEFAMVFPAMILLMLGIIEFGRALWMQNSLQYAVEQGARCAAINTATCSSQATVKTYVVTNLPGLATGSLTLSYNSAAACGKQVTGTLPFSFVAAALLPYTIASTATSCRPT
jgi:Flp pilus assembly protein TadG